MALLPGFVTLLCVLRNEIAILPTFFDHYRSIGIRQFILIDNGSTDGSTEFLKAQKDAIVFFTTDVFQEHNQGIDFQNEALRVLDYKGWILVVDADEFLVYEGMETADVQQLAVRMGDYNTVNSIMIDVYPDSDPLNYDIRNFKSIFSGFWFDTDYVFRRWPMPFWRPHTSWFSLQIVGGPRFRILKSLKYAIRFGAYYNVAVNQVDRFINLVPSAMMPLLAKVWPCDVPSLQKSPLSLVGENFRILNSHSNSNHNFANFNVGVIHIKFCAELKKRFEMAERENNYYRRSLHYIQLKQAMAKFAGKSLVYKGSRELKSSQDLVDAGLIGSTAAKVWVGQAS
jgi:hypothetical protein